jgi:hypothetical protein
VFSQDKTGRLSGTFFTFTGKSCTNNVEKTMIKRRFSSSEKKKPRISGAVFLSYRLLTNADIQQHDRGGPKGGRYQLTVAIAPEAPGEAVSDEGCHAPENPCRYPHKHYKHHKQLIYKVRGTQRGTLLPGFSSFST